MTKSKHPTPPSEREKTGTNENTGTSRRSFFVWVFAGLGMVALIEGIGVVAAYLGRGKKSPMPGPKDAVIDAGAAEDFPLNSVTAFVRGKFYLARLEDGGFLALSRKCTHLGCTVPWHSEENRFRCPCHASAFDIRGEIISAPAPRAMDIHPVVIENNIVRVNTARVIKRESFKEEQVVYPRKKHSGSKG